ncbi:MAG TPA: hypothetical protein VF179_26225 [Thermoanaerobaculia bacterium]|nr:hypothetical protein [Thermoanaerobaculia bacterium]
MLNKRWALPVLLFVLLGAVLSAREPSPRYEMEIRRTATGIELKCKSGCDWKELTGDCGEDKPCFFLLDQSGIRVLPEG